jgi:hypothetical protein
MWSNSITERWVKTLRAELLACPCRKRRSCWSGGVLVLVDDASDPVVSSDPEALEVGYPGWERPERSGTGQGHMRPVVIVVTLEGRQDPAEVREVPDEGAAGKLTAASAGPPLHVEFTRGIRAPLRTIRGPAVVNTASRPSWKMASRSCSTNLASAPA